MVALGFALYGGTAIALRLGHRPSVDFDFFSETPLDRGAIRSALPLVGRSRVVQDERDAWTMLVPSVAGERSDVKVSFFGGIDFGRVGEPELTSDGVVVAASLADLPKPTLRQPVRGPDRGGPVPRRAAVHGRS